MYWALASVMGPTSRKSLLTAHILVSVGCIGAICAFLVIASAGLMARGADAAGYYGVMELLAWWLILPLLAASLATGILQALLSEWGVFRHYWVAAKLAINIAATAILLLHSQPIELAAAAAREGRLAAVESVRLQLVVNSFGALLILLFATALSVWKPRGRTVDAGFPRWLKAMAIAFAVVVAAIAALHATGHGFGGRLHG